MGIIALRPVERAEGDVLRLAGLDPRALSEKVDADLEEIAELMSRVTLAWANGRTPDMRQAAAALGARCGALGLNRVSRVARTIESLDPGGDEVALAANVARLARLGHATLEEIWCLQDMPG